MIKKLLTELRKSAISVLPIYLLVMLMCLFRVIGLSGNEIYLFSISTIFIIIGIALFNYGAEHAMTPMGVLVGKGLTKNGKRSILLLVVFMFGFLITISEPDLSVLALQTKSVFPKMLLIISIGISVGFFMLLAVLKIIKKVNLIRILSVLYMIGFSLAALIITRGNESLIALAFDSGGVTTGPMTVPFLMALGSGVAIVLAQKSEKDASFGFIAFSSIGPVIMMLILSLFSTKTLTYELGDYTLQSSFFTSYIHYFLEKLKEVGLAIGLLTVFFLIINFIFLHLNKSKVLYLIRGMLFAYFGLVIFLAAVDATYMGIGFKIGQGLSNNHIAVNIVIAFIIGALTVLAEPAIKILNKQVEEATNGLIKQKSMLIALTIGVGIAITLAVLRIYFRFSLLYIIIPGYILCFIISFFIPKIYMAIAFDAGGVASGPLTSSFILPIAIGYCVLENSVEGVLSYGFGVISLVALSPLITIEILGLISNITNNRKVKNEIKRVLKEDDKLIISFRD